MTPDGRADAVDVEGRFVKPLEEKMSFKDIEEKKTQLIWNLVLLVVVFIFAVVSFRSRSRSRSK